MCRHTFCYCRSVLRLLQTTEASAIDTIQNEGNATNETSFFGVFSQNCEKRLLALSCLSVRLPTRNNSALNRRIYMKFDIWLFLENAAERVDVCVLCLSCDVLIPRSEEPYHACVLVCYPESSTVKRHRPNLGCCPIDKINLYSWFCVLVTDMNFTFVLRRLCLYGKAYRWFSFRSL
jgi:ferredoxin